MRCSVLLQSKHLKIGLINLLLESEETFLSVLLNKMLDLCLKREDSLNFGLLSFNKSV